MTTFALRSHAALRRSTTLACDTYGWGTPLVLIHGIGTTGALFTPLIQTLAAHYHVIVPDLRGHGRSSQLGSPTSVAQLASDVQSLFDRLGLRRCHVLGHGHGGLVAQQLAASAPERIHRMVLACTPAYADCSTRSRLAAALLPGAMRLLGSRALSQITAGATTCAQSHAAAAARLLLSFDSRPLHGQIACPTLVLQGEQDTLVPSHHGATLAQGLPNGVLRSIPGAGHRMLSTHTDSVIDYVCDWLI